MSVPKPDDVTWYFEGRQINAFENPVSNSLITIDVIFLVWH